MSEDKRAIGEESASYPGWRVTLASGIGVFVSFASLLVYTFGVFLKPLSEEFGWSRQAVSMAFGIAAMTVAVCSPPLGYLLDRFPPRRIIVPCMLVFGGAFTSLSLLTPHIGQFYAAFVVLGIVGNGTAQMAYSRAVSTWFVKRRGMAFAILMAGGAIGSMVLPPTAQMLIDQWGWRTAFAALGAMVLLLGLPIVASSVEEKPRAPHENQTGTAGASVAEGFRSRSFWILLAVLFASSISQNGALTHLSALLTDRGVSRGGAAFALSAMGASILFGRLLTGLLLDRFFAPRVSFCLLGISAAGVLLLSTAHSLATGTFAAVLIGGGMGGEADVTPYLLTRYFGLRCFSTLYGFTWTAYAVAGAIGPVLMGKAFDATHSYTAFLFQLSLFTLGSAFLMLLMPDYRAPGTLVDRASAALAEKA